MAKRKYPWENWLGQPRTVLRRDVDYSISQSMMYQTIKNNAAQRMVRVRVEDVGTGMVIHVLGDVLDGILHTDQAAVTSEHESPLASNGAPQETAAACSSSVHEGRTHPTGSTSGDHNQNRTTETR